MLKAFQLLYVEQKQQIRLILRVLQTGELSSKHGPLLSTLHVKIHGICTNLRNNLWQKWGGHAHASPPHGDALVHLHLD